MFDGTTVTMPDTPANQAAYPQIPIQRAGLGAPIARIGAIMSLSCGTIIKLGFSRYAGKGEGEVSLLRRLWACFHPVISCWAIGWFPIGPTSSCSVSVAWSW